MTLRPKPGVYRSERFVFTNVIGRPVKLDAPTKAFREVATVAKLPPEVTLHSLRHTFCLLDAGERRRHCRCSTVLGHWVLGTTLNLYSQLVAGGREKAIAAASETLRRVQATRAVGSK